MGRVCNRFKYLFSERIWVENLHVAPFFRSDPIGESEPDPGCLFNSFFFIFHLFVCFFLKCRDPNHWPDPNGGSEPEPGLLQPFSFILSKHLFIHFRFFNYAESLQMVGLKTFTLIQFIYKMAYHAFTK